MSKKIPLTLACGDYEIVRALKEGAVEPDGLELTILTRMDASTRHRRFFRDGDFDVAETSSSGYLVSRDKDLPFRAIPVFLHRRFRHGFIFINTSKGIKRPTDLTGKRIGVQQFLASACLWMRAILEDEYGVPYKTCEWFSEIEESVDFTPPAGLRLTRLPAGASVETMLAEGELDAVLHPEVIQPFVQGDQRVGRLFPDYKQEEMRYFQRTGIFPIMHLMGIRKEIIDRYPWVAKSLYQAFNQSKAIAMERMINPRIVPLAWYREAWEEQQAILGADPWQYGLTDRNRIQLERLIASSHAQGLISRRIPLNELFLPVQ
jgi:4,5-dihydroxyphthalate decarboxylase